jgi:hypothetical protein
MYIQEVGVDFDSLKKQEMIGCFQIRLGRITTATIIPAFIKTFRMA